MKTTWENLTIFALAAAALFFATGCNFDVWSHAVGYDPDEYDNTYVIVKCEPDTKQLQAYTLQTDFPGLPGGGPFDQLRPIGSPINGKPCSVSTEVQNRPFSESEAIDKGLLPSNSSQAKAAAGSRSATRLNDNFPGLVPLPFPPAFPNSDAGKAPLNCSATLAAYLVNHLQNTVTIFGLCPLRVLKEIAVR